MSSEPRHLPSRALVIPAAALLAAVALSTLLSTSGRDLRALGGPALGELLGYLAFWVPFAAAIAWWIVASPSARPMLRFAPIDVLWGLAVGFLARSAAALIDLAVYGRFVGPVSAPTVGEPPAPWVVLLLAGVVPVLVAPILEELFFRGVVLDGLRARSRSRAVTVVAVVVSALLFATMHLLSTTTAASAVSTGLSALLIGLGAALLAVTTGRLVAPVVAHVVFNAAIVLPALAQ